jgi:hypothetical protein
MKNTTPNPLILAKAGIQAFFLSVESDGENADLTSQITPRRRKVGTDPW